MSLSTSIGLVSESLRNLLIGEMDLTPTVPVTILAPDEKSGNRCINLFLYKVQENPHLRNQEWQVNPDNSGQLIPPPLSLNLFYLLTPYAENVGEVGNASMHEILGEAMRVLYQFPIVPNNYIHQDLRGAREQIRIMHNSLDLEELSQVWSTFSEPYRLSVLYEVSVVQLDQSSASLRDIPPRVGQIGVPSVEAPYQPPVVHRMEPTSLTAGAAVTFFGENLTGWNAYVSLNGVRLVDNDAISNNDFQATLPGNLVPGFYEIQVSVSHLFSRTFVFEVTP